MTLDQWLAEAQARCDAAFCAPWTYEEFAVVCDCGHDDCEGFRDNIRIESPHAYPDGQVVADVPGLETLAKRNGEFIAAARTDLPRALEVIRRMKAALEMPVLGEHHQGCQCEWHQVARAALEGES